MERLVGCCPLTLARQTTAVYSHSAWVGVEEVLSGPHPAWHPPSRWHFLLKQSVCGWWLGHEGWQVQQAGHGTVVDWSLDLVPWAGGPTPEGRQGCWGTLSMTSCCPLLCSHCQKALVPGCGMGWAPFPAWVTPWMGAWCVRPGVGSWETRPHETEVDAVHVHKYHPLFWNLPPWRTPCSVWEELRRMRREEKLQQRLLLFPLSKSPGHCGLT